MKITGQGPLNPFKAYQKQQAPKAKSNQTAPKNDTVELSTEAQYVRELTRMVDELPEVRADLVAKIKDQIEQGIYQVIPEELADSLLEFMAQEQ